jgi:hypothetical protein
VKILEHSEALVGHLIERNRAAFSIKQQGIPLDFRQRAIGIVRLGQKLQQFIDDM